MPRKGEHWSEEGKKRLSQAAKGQRRSPTTEFKKGSHTNLGIKRSAEQRQCMSEVRMGRKRRQEEKDKISQNNARYWLGRRRSPESIEKMRQKKLGRAATWNSGERSHFWNGGTGHEPYPAEFGSALRNSIRVRDNHTCQECGAEGARCVHHIDYDRENCRPENLITLCASCHSKTLFHRDEWREKFATKVTAL